MEMEPTFLPVLMDFTLKSIEKYPSIIAVNLDPNTVLCQTGSFFGSLTLRETVRNTEMKKGKIYLGGGSS